MTIVRILGYIWAGTQIRRDSYEPEPLYYKCEPYVQVDDQQALPADVYVEKNGAVVPVTRVYVCFVNRFSTKSEGKFRIFGSGIPFFRNGAWKQREVFFYPADLDRTRLAGWSVATATGGMGSEQNQAGNPPIA